MLTRCGLPGWAIPLIGGLAFSALVGLWPPSQIFVIVGTSLAGAKAAQTAHLSHPTTVRERLFRDNRGFVTVNDAPAMASQLARYLNGAPTSAGDLDDVPERGSLRSRTANLRINGLRRCRGS